MSESQAGAAKANQHRIISITLDEESVSRRTPDIEHERKIAIYDLLEENHFEPLGSEKGPYALHIAIAENRLVFDIRTEDETPHARVILSLTSFRRVIKDYLLICDSYYKAIRSATPSQIEALDMTRRSIHNDGSQILTDRLAGKIALDFDTARRLFTLICVLHLKG